jgi:hypothetical protein
MNVPGVEKNDTSGRRFMRATLPAGAHNSGFDDPDRRNRVEMPCEGETAIFAVEKVDPAYTLCGHEARDLTRDYGFPNVV